MSDALLEVRGLTVAYRTVRAVDGVDFDVRRGEILALLGPNGAGKTTTLRALTGIRLAESGEIAWHGDGRGGAPLSRIPPEELGYLPEERGLHRDVPVRRTLEFFGRLRGLTREEARRRAGDWLERLELGARAGEKLDALSKGNQQKVQLAAAVLHRPRLAILDEPFSGLDPLNQEAFLGGMRELRDAGTTILLSAHQLQLVERVADRILLLHRGRLVRGGTLDGLRRRAAAGAGTVDVRFAAGAGGAGGTGVPPDLPARFSATAAEDGWVRIALSAQVPLAAVLAHLGGRDDVRGLRTAETSLHDLYVAALEESPAPPAPAPPVEDAP